MAAKSYFGFPRRTDSFTLSGGSWLATYPLSNLQTLRDGLTRVARSLDATTGSTVIIATASAPVSASVLALVGHNLSQSAQWRIRIWSDVAGTVLVYDSGTVNVWPASYTAAELNEAVSMAVKRFAASGDITVGKIEIDITDTSNSAGYIQAGFLEIASAFDPAVNFNFGAQWGFDWRSQITKSRGGTTYVDPLPHPRIFKGSFDFTTQTDALGKFYEMFRQLKSDEPILFVPQPDETTHFNRLNVFGYLTDPGPASYRVRAATGAFAGIIHSVPISLEEIL